ncbi:MAG: hypothetical protein IKP00_17265 [Victivallales bacterium]|nr:hypothetical protein [Victivallales bacterium]
MLNLSIVCGMKFLTTNGIPLSQSATDRNRNMDVRLPDGRLLPTNAATAAVSTSRQPPPSPSFWLDQGGRVSVTVAAASTPS